MNKEDLYPLIGKYLNGYKIIKIEEDPFIKGQINLWTNEWITEYFGDKSIVKFFIRPESNSSKIYKELIDKENYKLKDNWNKLKDYIMNDINNRNGSKVVEFEDGRKAIETISSNYTLMQDRSKVMEEVLNKMQELEKGSDE